jgi:hypothetical protein
MASSFHLHFQGMCLPCGCARNIWRFRRFDSSSFDRSDHDGQRPTGVKAAACAGVAGGSDLLDLNQQRVAVAVNGSAFDILHVAGSITFAPVFLP